MIFLEARKSLIFKERQIYSFLALKTPMKIKITKDMDSEEDKTS